MFGARMAMLRRQKGLHQQELARMLGISPSAVGMYEQGRREPPLGCVVQLAEIFDVSCDYLLTGQPARETDLAAVRAAYGRALAVMDDSLRLRRSDGSEVPFSRQELALLFAALVG